MSERPTPETDAHRKPAARFAIITGDTLRVDLVPANFARKLERERDEAREEAKRLDGAYEDATKYYERITELLEELYEAKDALAALQARCDGLLVDKGGMAE